MGIKVSGFGLVRVRVRAYVCYCSHSGTRWCTYVGLGTGCVFIPQKRVLGRGRHRGKHFLDSLNLGSLSRQIGCAIIIVIRSRSVAKTRNFHLLGSCYSSKLGFRKIPKPVFWLESFRLKTG